MQEVHVLSCQSQQQTEQAATTEKTPSKSAIDFDSLRSLSSLGIDMSFLDSFGELLTCAGCSVIVDKTLLPHSEESSLTVSVPATYKNCQAWFMLAHCSKLVF